MKNNITILHKHSNVKDFESSWNIFLKENPHSFIHTLEYMRYVTSYCKKITNDESFVYLQNEIPVAICYFPIEIIKNYKSVSLNNGYVISPLCNNPKIEKKLFSYINTLTKEKNISQIKFYTDPNLEFNKANTFNNLKKYNFLEMNTLNATIDLRNSKELLWSNMSKSFKSLLNKYTKTTNDTLYIMDKTNASWEIMLSFYMLHKEIAKEFARDIELFQAQFELIEKGYASLIYIKSDDIYLSFGLFFHYNNFVTYASSVSKEIQEQKPLSHFILWNATLNFKEQGYNLIQYGQPSNYSKYSGIDDIADQKALNIASFKRNMGTLTTTLHRGIKFFDKQLLKAHLDNFFVKYTYNEE